MFCFIYFSLAWIVTSISYYVLGLNSSDLSGDIIMNFFLASIANSGSILYVVSTANSIGRRKSLSLAFMILGTSCLVLAFVPKNYDKIILTFYLIGTLVAGASMYFLTKPRTSRGWFPKFANMLHSMLRQDLNIVNKKSEIREIIFLKMLKIVFFKFLKTLFFWFFTFSSAPASACCITYSQILGIRL